MVGVTQIVLASAHLSRRLQAAKRRHLVFHPHLGAFTPLRAAAQLQALPQQALDWLRGIALPGSRPPAEPAGGRSEGLGWGWSCSLG